MLIGCKSKKAEVTGRMPLFFGVEGDSGAKGESGLSCEKLSN